MLVYERNSVSKIKSSFHTILFIGEWVRDRGGLEVSFLRLKSLFRLISPVLVVSREF